MEKNHNYEPFKVEMAVADIISKQAKHGVSFNNRNARWYVHLLKEIIVNIDKDLIPLLPKMRLDGTSYRKPFKSNGELSKFPKLFADRVGLTREEIGGPFTAIEYVPFDPSKGERVKKALLDAGFLPPEWNTTKKPWNVHSFRRDLTKTTYTKWAEKMRRGTLAQQQTISMIEADIAKFIAKHFKWQTVNYMKAYLHGLGFNVKGNRAPSFDQIKKKLALSDKWITAPTNLEETLEEGLDGELGQIGQLLKKRVVASHRLGLIEGLISKERVDGKLSAEANSCATPTFRFKHRIVVNIPSRGLFGHECRSLFQSDTNDDTNHRSSLLLYNAIASDQYLKPNTNLICEVKKGKEKVVGCHRVLIPSGREIFVGYDGSGLELRMLAHYLVAECRAMLEEAIRDGDTKKHSIATRGLESAITYRDILLDGDIHTHNQHLAGLPTRDSAKSFIYAFNYGAGNLKLGSLVGGGADEGLIMRERFLQENPCIAILIERMTEKAKRGYIIGIDGRRITMRRDSQGAVMVHKALNTLLQSAGAIVMKYAMILLDKWIKRDKLRCHKVIDMHDEGQFSCHRDDVEKLKALTLKCVTKAGEYLKMECPLASDCKVGLHWMHTH